MLQGDGQGLILGHFLLQVGQSAVGGGELGLEGGFGGGEVGLEGGQVCQEGGIV